MSDAITLTVVQEPEIALNVSAPYEILLTVMQDPEVVLTIGPETGPPGPAGAPGTEGPFGAGVPVGGIEGALLAKSAGGDYATAWSTSLASVITIDGGLL